MTEAPGHLLQVHTWNEKHPACPSLDDNRSSLVRYAKLIPTRGAPPDFQLTSSLHTEHLSRPPGQLQAESVSHHLRAPVLLHAALKPSYACACAALAALPGLAPHELIVVGDRVFTDVVLAHRLSHSRTLASRIAAHLRLPPAQDSAPDDAGSSEIPGGKSPRAPLAVWTTGVWKRESVGMRWAEAQLVRLIERHVEGTRERRDALEERFVRRALDSGNRAGKADDRGWFSWVKGYLPRFG